MDDRSSPGRANLRKPQVKHAISWEEVHDLVQDVRRHPARGNLLILFTADRDKQLIHRKLRVGPGCYKHVLFGSYITQSSWPCGPNNLGKSGAS